jgi:hypothetical protein
MPLLREQPTTINESSMTGQTNIDFGRQNRDAGIKRAVDHADHVTRDWSTMAYEFFTNVFLKHHKGQFMAEDFRAQCKGIVPDPPSLRAFGGIIIRAKCAGLITRVGIKPVKNPKAQMANASVWKST